MTATEPTARSRPPEGDLDLVLRRVRAHARRRAAWLRHLWSREQVDPVPGLVTHAEVDTLLLDADSPEQEAAWLASSPEARALTAEIEDVEDARERACDSEGGRLARLWRALDLGPLEVDLLDLLIAVDLEPALARVYAYLQDDATLRYPTAALAARMFGHGRTLDGAERLLAQRGLLAQHARPPGDPPALALEPWVLDWLTGRLAPAFVEPCGPLPSWPVEETVDWARSAMQRGARLRVTVVGLPGSGRRSFAAACSARLGRRLLVAGPPPADHAAGHVHHASALALLEGAALGWLGAPGADAATPDLQWVFLEPGEGRAATHHGEWSAGQAMARRVVLPVPSVAEREALWAALVPGAGAWAAETRSSLAARFRATPGEIAAVGRQGVADVASAEQAVRELGRARLGGLAEVVDCPFDWDDLVVSDAAREQLRDLRFVAEARPRLWERPEARRLFPGGRGLLALFSGPPGTGKTMASQVLAASLGVDLVRIDLSQVVSKYVGETSQNLERILQQAERLDVVLLFDEADAIFGRRTDVKDAHDRYANTDTAYLLQAIEKYPGLAVLATNRKADIDPAFLRRFRFIVEFEKPGPQERAVMWERLLTELAGAEAWSRLRQEVLAIAAGVEATGAQIKFAVLGALLLAQQEGSAIEARHVLRGLARELEKDGRPFGERERARLLRGRTS